ncbi:MAG: hypothetical protein BWX96_00627 [Bacteroidetes bacterium ADurb.Bin145]|jgi:hypothetical protein|nr:MAG: hypothetical protein BWX96_00627 [Bacteroidetes bacterium ADurb.Bin145]
MEEYWNLKEIHNFSEYFRHKKYHIYKLVEPLWQRYLTGYLDYPITTFENYLISQWSIVFRPETIRLEITIWFEIRNKILQ